MSAPSGMSLIATRRFGFLFASQFCGVISDNIAKTAIGLLLAFSANGGASATAIATGLFILPYALFAPLAGNLADGLLKHWVVRTTKLSEIPVVLFAGLAIWSASPAAMLAAMFFAGLQATFFSPVKYAILAELVAPGELVSANAFIEAGTFVGILIGTILGGLVGTAGPTPIAAIILCAVSGLGAVFAFRVPRTFLRDPAVSLSLIPFPGTRQLLRDLRSWRRAHAAAVALSWFWTAGAILLSAMAPYALDVLHVQANSNGATILLTALAGGIGLGSGLYGFIARRRGAVAAIPVGFVGMGLAILGAASVSGSGDGVFYSGVFWFSLASVFGGLLSVPLYVALQDGAPPEARARAVSGNNLLNAIYMVAGSLVVAAIGVLAPALGFDAASTVRMILVAAAVATFCAAPLPCIHLPEVASALFGPLLRLIYRVEIRGLDNLAAAGPSAVIVPNHVSWIDAALLATNLPGPPAFAVDTFVARKWWVRQAAALVEALPVDATNPMAIKTLVREVKAGRHCVIFPEGRLTRTGRLMKIYDGPATIADKAGAPLVAVRIDGAEHSVWSRLKGVYRQSLFPKITITVMPPVYPKVAPEIVGRKRRQALTLALYDLMSGAAFTSFDSGRTVFQALLDASKEHGPRDIIEDIERRPVGYGRLITLSLILGRAFSRRTAKGEFVGVLLPNATATVAAFFGLQAFGRIPAMLNYSTGAENMAAASKLAGLRTIITSRRFIELGKLDAVVARLNEVATVIFLEDLRGEIGMIAKLRGLIDRQLARRRSRKDETSPDAPAVVLFTSGSEGVPKGVVLSHRNMLANTAQAGARIAFNSRDVLLNALPIFHAFGMTGALILPLISGVKVVLYPNPLHFRRVPEIAYDSGATILFGTDTFLAGYAKQAHPYDFDTLRYIFAGAERIRKETREIWATKFGVRILEGYGTTETAPVIAINTPMNAKEGTVGRVLPGIATRLDPVEGIVRGGRLFVSGPNIMLGYLSAIVPGAIDAPPGGWYDTGDIVEIDGDGHVTIVGRAKRFAKIAGEMVSLSAVEEWAGMLWPEFRHAAAAVPDRRKGERIILVSTQPNATRTDFAAFIRARGLPEIATPSEVIVIAELPVLGTGKTNYVAVQEIAFQSRVVEVA